MRRKIIVMFCSLLAFAVFPAWAQAPAPARGALFRVEGGGHTLYLFGTIHVGAPDFYPLEARVTEALEQAGVLALELDPLGDPGALQAALQRHGIYPPGAAPAQVAPAFQPRLRRLLARYAIAPEAAARMKPWLLASALAVGAFEAEGYQSALAVDTWLARRAHARGIEVLELESAESQMALFGALPAAGQRRLLEEGIAAIDDQEQIRQARQIVRAWRTADAAGFDALAREAARDRSFSGRFMQRTLLDGRNPGLADGIARLLARAPRSMAAIGVLHLVGAGSVPDLLKRKGLTVVREY